MSRIVDPVRIEIKKWLQQPVKSILSGLLVVMLFPMSVKGESMSATSGAKELKWMMTMNQRLKTLNPPR